jgi:signal transduction histidine kinase
MHRRIFTWLVVAIIVAGSVASGVAVLFGNPMRNDLEGARRIIVEELADRWSDASARDRFARSIANNVHFNVLLDDAAHRPLAAFGKCEHAPPPMPVVRSGETVGYVRMCASHEHQRAPMRGAVLMGISLMVLWAASGIIARRLSRPLVDLATVAEEIGRGKLSRRTTLRAPVSERRNVPHDEVDVVAGVLDDMTARVEKQIRDQRELLAAVSHEIRTPLARIRLLVEMARDTGATAKTFDGIDDEVVEIDALVSQLLASARLEFQALTLHAIDPRQAALRALERANVGPERMVADEGLPTVEADATLLARALANLLENARRHAGGVDRLRVSRRDGEVEFLVDDRGPGLPDGDPKGLFLPFVQLGGGPREPGAIGLGLGLALVARIVEAHGGRTIAEQREGGGATVGFSLPIDGPPHTEEP